MLLELAASAELFHTANGTAFADLMIAGHRETWPVRSLRFRAWLRRRCYEATGGAPSPAAFRSALDTLEAQAQFDAPRRTVYMRVAEQDGRLYLDIADEHWRAVEIGPEGWRVVASPPVRFRRAAGMLPLPMPVKGQPNMMLASMVRRRWGTSLRAFVEVKPASSRFSIRCNMSLQARPQMGWGWKW